MNSNIFVIGLDMDDKTPKDIAKAATNKIKELTDSLIDKQKEEEKKKYEL